MKFTPAHLALNYIKLFNVYVLCSVTEGLSQSLLEAMYLEVPVVATNASGNNDLIEDGVNGFLFENNNVKQLAEKMNLVYHNPTLALQLTQNAKLTVTHKFSIESTVNHYENFFYSLIDEPKAPYRLLPDWASKSF